MQTSEYVDHRSSLLAVFAGQGTAASLTILRAWVPKTASVNHVKSFAGVALCICVSDDTENVTV
jgi:hypothetical protein